jgi:exopolysaccharide biosynthesis polyprenyl glycosylphosphotransferase
MEPNPLASYNAPGSAADRSLRRDEAPAVHAAESRLAHDAGAARNAEAGLMGAPGYAPAVTPLNGHARSIPAAASHLNGHSNGDPSWGTLTLQSLAGATYAPGHPAAETRHDTLYLRIGKRWIDVVGALVGLVLSAPLLLVAAICIKLESRGSVLYKSKRIGRSGRPFTFFKLRSMVNGADRNRDRLSHLNESDGPVFKIARDPRVTRIGRFLRTTSIDELPQLFNVLSGDMSLVGPRPPIAEEVAQYEPWQFRRLEVRPGLTCLWQISGRSRIGFQEWMRLDLEYIRKQSFWLDVKILIRTIPAVLSREGAY